MAKNSHATGPFKNELLAKLPAELIASLSPQAVELPVNFVLFEPNAPIEHVYFPENAVVSVISIMESGSSIEVGTIGREGMAGSAVLLETASTPYRSFVQVGDGGHRIGVERFKQAAKGSDILRTAALKYEAAFRTQTMQGMACNGLHNVEQRCCRWLLMTRDRVDTDDIKLTHEFLALMLGVRRPSVTEVLAPLQAAGLVHSNRGTISILNRKGLEARVCECYRVMTNHEREAKS
jgi:CRP-like cAMP-binding protein